MKKLKKQTSINPLLISFFFIINHSLCIDPWYESCLPKDCGDGVNISYPFFINGLQNSSCGYPGFNLTCNNNSSMLHISGNNFIVKQIDNKKRLIRLQNAAISSNRSTICHQKIANLTLDPNRFRIDGNETTNLVLISNCSGRVSTELERYKIASCENRTEFVVGDGDRNLWNVTESCGGGGRIVEIPVELGGGDGRKVVVDGGNYRDVVENGFLLRWFAADCSVCQRSGGRCGFNTTVFQFSCFCTDRPHKVRCKPGKKFNIFVISAGYYIKGYLRTNCTNAA